MAVQNTPEQIQAAATLRELFAAKRPDQYAEMMNSGTTSPLFKALVTTFAINKIDAQMGATNPALASKGTLGATRTEVQNIQSVQQAQRAPTLAETQQKDNKLADTNIFKPR